MIERAANSLPNNNAWRSRGGTGGREAFDAKRSSGFRLAAAAAAAAGVVAEMGLGRCGGDAIKVKAPRRGLCDAGAPNRDLPAAQGRGRRGSVIDSERSSSFVSMHFWDWVEFNRSIKTH